MKIKSVSLQNVKSYDESSPSIRFQQGVNAIIGENGSGKSTLCEAIGFVLFDFLHPYSQADFIREGNKYGKVSVTFESDHSNHVYRVDRGVGNSKYDVFDVQSNSKLSLQGKDDVLTWLKDELGVPASLDLQTLWKSSLGVPQGKFTNDFAETPSIRAQLFNPLLEVDVYRTLWQKMKGVVDVIVENKNQMLDRIARLESVVEELPELEKQLKHREQQIQQTKKIVSKTSEEISSLEQQKKRLETIKKDIEKGANDLSVLREKQNDVTKQLEQTKKQFEEAKKAQHIVSTHAKDYEHFVSNSETLESLLEKKKEKEALEKKSVALDKKTSLFKEQLRHLDEEVHIAEKSKQEMKSLKDSVKKQEYLEEKLSEITQKEKEISQIKSEINQIQEKISKLRKDYGLLQKQIKEITKKKEIAKKKDALQKNKDELLQEKSVFIHQQKENKKAVELLKDRKTSVCPTCSRPLDESHRSEIISIKIQEIKNVKKKENEIEEQLQNVTSKLLDAENAEQEVKRLPDLESMLISIQQEADEHKEKKDSLDKKLSTLQDEIAQKEVLQKKLDQLDNPKKAFEKAKVRYEDHKGKKEKRDQLKETIVNIKKEHDQLSQQLEKYEGLEEEIEELEKTQKELKESYELYLRYKDLASKGKYWKETVETLQSSLKQIKEDSSQLSETLSKKKKEFDDKEFSQLKSDLEEKKQLLVHHKTQIDEWMKQTQDLEAKVNEKQQQKQELNELQNAVFSLDKDIEFAQFLRETYQKSRPLITEILVEEISREADRIYRELRGVASEELAWKKDYEIVVYDSGNKRAFHKLSGGEQMCAALAVRLAILKLLSTMDIVFLDEPTMNLDDEKKDNLVSQLRELSGFSQIFVISHDETFESMTEHVITLEKRQGATRLLNHFQGGF